MVFEPRSKLMSLKYPTASYSRSYQENHIVTVSPPNQVQFTSRVLQIKFWRARGFPHLLYGLRVFWFWCKDSDTKPFLQSKNAYQLNLYIAGTLGTFSWSNLEKVWCQNFQRKSSLFYELKHEAFAHLYTTGSKWHCSIKCNILRLYLCFLGFSEAFLDIQVSSAEAEWSVNSWKAERKAEVFNHKLEPAQRQGLASFQEQCTRHSPFLPPTQKMKHIGKCCFSKSQDVANLLISLFHVSETEGTGFTEILCSYPTSQDGKETSWQCNERNKYNAWYTVSLFQFYYKWLLAGKPTLFFPFNCRL